MPASSQMKIPNKSPQPDRHQHHKLEPTAFPFAPAAGLDVSQRKKMITWAQVEQDFELDGSLRDIYVRSATIKDWRAVYNLLKRNTTLGFCLDGDVAALPEDVTEVFAMRPLRSPMLRVDLGCVTVVIHFFTDEEIECDIDPRDVKSQVELDAVLEFLKEIGDCVAKPVLLTLENCREYEILRYDPCFHEFQHAAQRNG